MRILFTGGSGKAGRHVVGHLLAQGHHVTNLDITPLDHPKVSNLTVDLTDSGQVLGAASQFSDFYELEAGTGVPTYDAIIHFAAVARVMLTSDAECFRVNTLSTYNVLEAAAKFRIPKVIIASSETTYGVCFADGEMQLECIPVDENHPTVPHDSYAMSKVCNEACARSFQARTGADIYALRLNNVIEPHEYAVNFPDFVNAPEKRRRNIFSYIDTRDLSQFVDRCLDVDGLGFEIFNVANADHSVAATTSQLIEQFYKTVPQTREMGEDETFYSIEKARRLLGYDPQHSWKDYVEGFART